MLACFINGVLGLYIYILIQTVKDSFIFLLTILFLVSEPSPSSTPKASPSPLVASSPSQHSLGLPLSEKHHSYHLTMVPGIGIVVTAVAVMMLLVLIVLIRRKSKELLESENIDKKSSKSFPSTPMRKFQEGTFLVFFFLLICFHSDWYSLLKLFC